MASGWARDGAVQEQIDQTVTDAVGRAREHLRGDGQTARQTCAECGEPIATARRKALPGVQFCVACQTERDDATGGNTPFNRRASKDSLLR